MVSLHGKPRRIWPRALALFLSSALLVPAGVARADDAKPRAEESTCVIEGQWGSRSGSAAVYEQDSFDELERAEDEGLEQSRAGYRGHEHHWHYHHGHHYEFSPAETVLLIIFFPIGIIVFTVVLLTD